ncbi:MAG: ribokinase [Clostridiales bacterium]|jgi:ribokinase|nr:ribokinase [Clostridiales bacterium]
MGKIVVVGSINMDLVAHTAAFPRPGQSVLGTSFSTFPGGKGANQCVAAARLGGDVEMVGMVGGDAYGKELTDLFAREGIARRHVYVADAPTSTAIILISDQSAENEIVVIPTANYAFGSAELKKAEAAIRSASMVVAQLELRQEVVDELVLLCRAAGVPVMLNPAPVRGLSDEILRGVAYLTPNETELEVLSGLPAGTLDEVYAAADALLQRGVRCVVATLGKRGALVADAAGKTVVPGYPVKAVDTVAAGDSFNGALATALVAGKPVREAAAFANAVGALTVTKRGAIPSLPTLEEVRSFLRSR